MKSSAMWEMSVNTSASTFGSMRAESKVDEFKSDVKSSARWEMSVNASSAFTFGSSRVENKVLVDMLSRSELMLVVSRGESRRISKSSGMVKAESADAEISMI